jgi:hypothetical protein
VDFSHFMQGMLCSMASFKQHVLPWFWKGSLVLNGGKNADAMGQFGRITKASNCRPENAGRLHQRKPQR